MGCGAGARQNTLSTTIVEPITTTEDCLERLPTTAMPPPPEHAEGAEDAPRPRAFLDSEREDAWLGANFYAASSGHERPIALWIIGPSAVGKTTLSKTVCTEFDIGVRKDGPPDAVMIDGEFFRDAHGMYKEWAHSSEWASAYPAMKPMINQEKHGMLIEASKQQKHLIIPHTCLQVEVCIEEMRELIRRGYINHVLAVTAAREEVAHRGRERELKTGKRYASSEYSRSIAAFEPMILGANGRYELVRAIELNDGGRADLGHRTLARGPSGSRPNLRLVDCT